MPVALRFIGEQPRTVPYADAEGRFAEFDFVPGGVLEVPEDLAHGRPATADHPGTTGLLVFDEWELATTKGRRPASSKEH